MHDLETIVKRKTLKTKPINTIKEYRIHIPILRNDGKHILDSDIDTMLDTARHLFNGYTYDHKPRKGAWYNSFIHKAYIEDMTALYIATDDYNKLERFVISLREQFKQECMYVVQTGAVNFI